MASACTPPASSSERIAVDHAVALDPALPFERAGHDIDAEMRLPARPMPGMTFMLVRFVHHVEALRRKGLGQLLCRWSRRFACQAKSLGVVRYCQVLKMSPHKAHSVRS